MPNDLAPAESASQVHPLLRVLIVEDDVVHQDPVVVVRRRFLAGLPRDLERDVVGVALAAELVVVVDRRGVLRELVVVGARLDHEQGVGERHVAAQGRHQNP